MPGCSARRGEFKDDDAAQYGTFRKRRSESAGRSDQPVPERLHEKTPTLLVIDDLHQENCDRRSTCSSTCWKRSSRRSWSWSSPTSRRSSVELDAQTLVVPDLSEEDTYQVALAILHSSELGPRLKNAALGSHQRATAVHRGAAARSCLQDGYIDQSEGLRRTEGGRRPRNAARRRARTGDQPPGQLQPGGAAAAARGVGAGRRISPLEALQAVAEMDDPTQVRGDPGRPVAGADAGKSRATDVYRFRHGLTQRVIYESLARAQRLKLHRLAVRYWREHREVSLPADCAGVSPD